MAISKFLDPKNDFAFKKVFGTERNKDILMHFINDILEFKDSRQIQKVTFLKPAQDPEVAAKKQSIVDVLCEDENGKQYIIEMQVARVKGFEKRAQYYAAKAYVNQLNQSEQYGNLKEIIFLAITDFVMFPDKPGYKSDHVILDRESYSQDLKDFSFTFLELPKFNKEIGELSNMVEKWTYFFKHADETTEEALDQIVGQDQVLEKAYAELNKLTWTENQLKLYEQELKSERDFIAMMDGAEEKGIQKGVQQGIQQGIQLGEAGLLIRQLKAKFKTLPDKYLERINNADPTTLSEWSINFIHAQSLEEIFE